MNKKTTFQLDAAGLMIADKIIIFMLKRMLFSSLVERVNITLEEVIGLDIESEKQNIQKHIDKGNYHAGINLAISAMNECRRTEDQTGVDVFLNVIKAITERMFDEFGSKS